MFKNDYQTGECLELFTVHGKDPLSKLKICGLNVSREFNDNLRSYVLDLQGEPARSNITFPKSGKLCATQNYLVLQLFLYSKRSFSLEFTVANTKNYVQRIIISSSAAEVSRTALHAKLPGSVLQVNTWISLCFDISDLMLTVFDGSSKLDHLEAIKIAGNCKVKRMFTLRDKPVFEDSIPKSLKLAITSDIQIVDSSAFEKVSAVDSKQKKSEKPSVTSIENSHIAFGGRIPNGPRVNNQTYESENSKPRRRMPRKPLQKNEEKDENNNTLVAKKFSLTPRPPTAKKSGNERRPRVKSADLPKIRKKENNNREGKIFSKSADTRHRPKHVSNSRYFNDEESHLRKVQRFKSLERMNDERPGSGESFNNYFAVLPAIKPSLIPASRKQSVETPSVPLLNLEAADDNFEKYYLKMKTYSSNEYESHEDDSDATRRDLFAFASQPRSVHSKNGAIADITSSGVSSYASSQAKSSGSASYCVVSSALFEASTANRHRKTFDSIQDNELNDLNNNKDTNNVDNSPSVDKFGSGLPCEIEQSSTDKPSDPNNNNTVSIVVTKQKQKLNETKTNKVAECRQSARLPEYEIPRDSMESDTMSWLNLSVHKPIQGDGSPQMQRKLEEKLGSLLQQQTSHEDDDTSECSSVIAPPIRNYRYQDEFKNIEHAFKTRIPESPRSDREDTDNEKLPTAAEEREENLNLLYDDDLNCYYDPHTEKYYQLA